MTNIFFPLQPSDTQNNRHMNVFVCFRSTPAVLDISGFATIPETPRRPPTAAPASLHVLRRPPLEGEYISVTDSSGSRVYLRQKEDTGTKVKLCSSYSSPMLNVTQTFWATYITSGVQCLYMLHLCISLCVCLCLQIVGSRMLPNSQGELGLLAVPIGVLREHEAERVSDHAAVVCVLAAHNHTVITHS